MTLTDHERSLLNLRHGNAYEVRAIRLRLTEAGLKWCPLCGDALPVESFAPNGQHLQMACERHEKVERRDYVPVGNRNIEHVSRYRVEHPQRERARKKGAYEARKAQGMTGRQANYMEPIP